MKQLPSQADELKNFKNAFTAFIIGTRPIKPTNAFGNKIRISLNGNELTISNSGKNNSSRCAMICIYLTVGH